MGSPSDTTAWQALEDHSTQFKRADFRLSKLFQQKDHRFDAYSLQHEDLLLDFSKNYLEQRTLSLLVDLAKEQQLPQAITSMFAGENINRSEQRPALHVALREPAVTNRFPEVSNTLGRMAQFVVRIHQGDWKGHNGKRIEAVVNIGIGGSELGPSLVIDALAAGNSGHLKFHFVSNIDPSALQDVLDQVEADTTLFIIASKSFTTLETCTNAATARAWFIQQSGAANKIKQHFVAITQNQQAATEFGIDETNQFPIWDWVGGRYSLWSAIGLPIALCIGMDNFRQLLAGAHSMDSHFKEAALGQNMPVILGLLSVWYRGFFGSHSSAVVPYSQRLGRLPVYLQALSMESLGKSVDNEGSPVGTKTGAVLWGAVGTNSQHSFFQLLHQGTEFIPVDFIASVRPGNAAATTMHQQLLANCFSQSLALMDGVADPGQPHKAVAGNRPSNTLLVRELSPYNLGSLLALFEHKTYVQSVLWNINAFDQWGVEFGKTLSQQIFKCLTGTSQAAEFDASTSRLIDHVRNRKSGSL